VPFSFQFSGYLFLSTQLWIVQHSLPILDQNLLFNGATESRAKCREAIVV